MKHLKRTLLTLLMGLLVTTAALARTPVDTQQATVITFRFLPGNDKFILQGNEAEQERLFTLVDRYLSEITAGRIPVQVDGYCASLPTAKENLTTAFIRANRVKSELITHKGLKEANFVTGNYAHAYLNNKDVVVVTLRIPAKGEPNQPESAKEQPQPAKEKPQPKATPQEEPKAVAATKPQPMPAKEPQRESKSPYRFAVRTNLLYDAMLLPTLGVEWRVNEQVGIRIDGSLSHWGGEHGKVQKVWLLNPEVRWYLGQSCRLYLGASGTYGEYNIYKYMIGNMLKDNTGYQGKLWNAGLTIGYQLYLSRSFSVDFNLGLGYTHSDYDSFGMTEDVRIYKARNQSKSIWGPTQAGISLIWTLGNNK